MKTGSRPSAATSSPNLMPSASVSYGHEDVDSVGLRVVELHLDGVGRLAAVRVGERHVRGDAGRADRALGRAFAEPLVQREQNLADVRAGVVVDLGVRRR